MKYYNNNRKSDIRRKYDEKEYARLNAPDLKGSRASAETAREKTPKEFVKSKSFAKKAPVIAAALVIIAAVSVFIPAISANAAYSEGYEVWLNGQSFGVVSDPQPVQQALAAIEEEYGLNYGMQVYTSTTLAFNLVKIKNQYICPPDLYVELLRQHTSIQVMAWVISVDSRPVVALKTQEEANQVLARILEPYQQAANSGDRTQIGFSENVEVINTATSFGNVTDVDSAYKIMVYGSPDYEEKWHYVVTGETLSEIAQKYGLKVTDLKKANLFVAATDKIYPGDELLITKPNNCVNVKYVKIIDRDEDYEADPVYEYDDSMYVSEKYVKQEGMPGRRRIVAEMVYMNGIEASYTIDESKTQIYEAAIPAVIVKGTKAVPAIVEMASEGRMPYPLKGSYTISSPFGKRDISDQSADASKFHMGIDFDADTGTPIYASAAGTVSFSGSSSGNGLLIKISHDGGVETRYGHCSQLLVEKGDHVQAGQLIGLVGNTGTSTGSHLHFEIRLNGVPQDPEGKYVGVVPGY